MKSAMIGPGSRTTIFRVVSNILGLLVFWSNSFTLISVFDLARFSVESWMEEFFLWGLLNFVTGMAFCCGLLFVITDLFGARFGSTIRLYSYLVSPRKELSPKSPISYRICFPVGKFIFYSSCTKLSFFGSSCFLDSLINLDISKFYWACTLIEFIKLLSFLDKFKFFLSTFSINYCPICNLANGPYTIPIFSCIPL